MIEAERSASPVSRRSFVRAGAAGAAGLAAWAVLGERLLGAVAASQGSVARARGPANWRLPLNTGWRFGGRLIEGSTGPDFDDSGFEEVTLPHCVADLSWSNWEAQSWEDEFIYRRRIEVPRENGGVREGMRVFLDFEGSMTGTTPTLNGEQLEQHLGGYLPFSYEITDHLNEGENVLAVVVDGRFLDVPPNGNERGTGSVDYLQPGGIYRDVYLRVVPPVFLKDVFAKPVDVLKADQRKVEVQCTLDGAVALDKPARIEVELRDGERLISRASTPVEVDEAGEVMVEATLSDLAEVELWDIDNPHLYEVVATLVIDDEPLHDYRTRIGFREARFEVDGFFLNGRRVKAFGLNRHQTFPYTGHGMPRRVQRRDAELLKNELNCNMVRCSHYPQSGHFLDACDEIGLLVWEEIPGWQFVGDDAWQELALRDTEVMVRRNRNRPSVVTWGVRINESRNVPELYKRTRDLAKSLDDSRQTTGAMLGRHYGTEDFHQDLFSYNDYRKTEAGAALRPPRPDIPFLVTEAIGSLTGAPLYRRIDPMDVQRLQAYLHAQAHHQVGADDRYAGLLAWSAIDYPSYTGGNRIYRNMKWNGVLDIFRVPKLGAATYQSQVDPRKRPVIAPAFYWDFGSEQSPDGPGDEAMIGSNCDRLEVYVDGEHHASLTPDLENFGYLPYPPFFADLSMDGSGKPELRIDGYVGDEVVLSRSFSADPSDDRLLLEADDEALVADGSDATRVMFRAVDRHGAPRPYVGGEVQLELEGPGVLIGDNPFDLAETGGVAAVWVKTVAGQTGEIRLRASHEQLGSQSVQIEVRQAEGAENA